jgi:hypothetical protein
MFTFDSKELFPINIDMLIDMKVYDRKNNGKSKLTKNFILDTEFKVQKATPESSGVAFDIQKVTLNKKGGSGLLKENIMLTIDCFKSMCMLSNSEIGKQVKNYYLDLEKIFKQYIIIEFQEKQLQLTQEKEEKLKYLKLYNQKIQKHKYHKFNIKGPCFYVVVQGIEPLDGITRIKIGIAGCPKKIFQECPNCSHVLEDIKQVDSLDKRLSNHRTLWPQLQVKMVVSTKDAALLEKNMKRLYCKQINPGGHEIIEGVSLEEVIGKTKGFLNIFNFYNKDDKTFFIETDENLDKYNENTLTHMKPSIKKIIEIVEEKVEEIKEVIEEMEEKVYAIKEDIKDDEKKVNEINKEIETYKKYLAKSIAEYKDVELKEILSKLNLVKNGDKQAKYDRLMTFIKEQLVDLENTKDEDTENEDDEDTEDTEDEDTEDEDTEDEDTEDEDTEDEDTEDDEDTKDEDEEDEDEYKEKVKKKDKSPY